MNIEKILERLKQIGCYGKVAKTGHPDYVRVYVLTQDGNVQLGRATVFQGKYDHMKWYIRPEGEMSPWDYYSYAWQLLVHHNIHLTKERYARTLVEANERAKALTAERKQWRDDHPKPNGGKRQRLAPPNPRRFMTTLLINERS